MPYDDSKVDSSLGGTEEDIDYTPVRGVPVTAAWARPIEDLAGRIAAAAKDGRRKREALEERVAKMERRLVAISGENGDNGKLGNLEEKMSDMTTTIGRIDLSAEKTAESAAGWWKWAVGMALPIVVLVVGAWIKVDSRMSVIEVRVDASYEKIHQVDTALDRIDQRLDVIGDRLGARAAVHPASVPAAAAGSGAP